MTQKYVSVLLSETKGWYDKVIRFLSNSKYSHASLSIDEINFYTFNYKGFQEEHPHHMKTRKENLLIKIAITDEEYDILQSEISHFKMKKEQYKYSLLGIVCCILHIPFSAKNKYFCSQFVIELLKKAGVVRLSKRSFSFLPIHVMKLLKSYEGNHQLLENAF